MNAGEYRRHLVDHLVASGAVRSDRVRDAFRAVAREDFVPRYRRPDGHWTRSGADPQGWLRGVYADEVLVTRTRAAADVADPDGVPTSSSSMPSVMAGMLEALDVRPGHRVLEIGTGTGYNTALLCHLAGPENVVSVELDPELAAAARDALHRTGLHPVLRIGDGRAEAVVGPGPFDRIVATAAADHVPPGWITALTADGVVVLDLRGSLGGGLARLTRTGDDAVGGRFLDAPGAFMPLRGDVTSPHRDEERWDRPLDRTNPQLGVTGTDPALLADPVLRLIVQCHFGGKRLRGFLPDPDGPTWSGRATDGSWFTVDTDAREDGGPRGVRQGGPQRLWDTVEVAVAAWEHLGRPAIGDLRVVARDHPSLQHVESVPEPPVFRWPLPL